MGAGAAGIMQLAAVQQLLTVMRWLVVSVCDWLCSVHGRCQKQQTQPKGPGLHHGLQLDKRSAQCSFLAQGGRSDYA